MQKNFGISRIIRDLIHNPPQHWRVLSQALVNAYRNCLLAVDYRSVIFLANKIAQKKFGVTLKSPLKDVIPELVGIVDKTVADGNHRTEISLQVESEEYLTSVSPLILEGELVGVICLLEESTNLEKIATKMHFFQNIIRELDAIIDSSSEGLFACDAQNLVHNGVTTVSEGANMPTTPEGIDIFLDAGILYGPGKAANAGGVAVSGLEMTQNSMRLSWTREEVDNRLKMIMSSIHKTYLDAAEQYGTPGNYVIGANIAGFVKVADAMMDQGIV